MKKFVVEIDNFFKENSVAPCGVKSIILDGYKKLVKFVSWKRNGKNGDVKRVGMSCPYI